MPLSVSESRFPKAGSSVCFKWLKTVRLMILPFFGQLLHTPRSSARWISRFIRTSSGIPTSHDCLRAGWISRRFNISQDTLRSIWRCAFIPIISTNRASKAPHKRFAPHLAENRCHTGATLEACHCRISGIKDASKMLKTCFKVKSKIWKRFRKAVWILLKSCF